MGSIKIANILIDANVCKNDRCSNLAIINAPEYISPSYLLGFPALHCSKCGSNALLLNNDDIVLLLQPKIDFYLTQVKGQCPRCHSSNKIHYGKTQQKTPRMQCKKCHLVYSPKKITHKQQENLLLLCQLLFSSSDFQQIITTLKISYSRFYYLLKQLEFVCKKNKLLIESRHLTNQQYHVSTKSKIFMSRGKFKSMQLWGLTSSMSDSGYILLNNLNYTDQPISSASIYDSQKEGVIKNTPPPNITTVIDQYKLFSYRKSFDQLTYHSYAFPNNNKGKVVEPVVCAYSHFYELKQYYSSQQIYHYLEHEIILRSAAITAYGDDVRNKHCMIFYIYESSLPLTHKISTIHRYKIGWWQNEWYVLTDSNHKVFRLLGLLSYNKRTLSETKISTLPATFRGIDHFYQMFEQYFPQQRLAKLSSSNIQLLLNIFTCMYNFCLSDNEGKTVAQKLGLCSKRLTFAEMIKRNE